MHAKYTTTSGGQGGVAAQVGRAGEALGPFLGGLRAHLAAGCRITEHQAVAPEARKHAAESLEQGRFVEGQPVDFVPLFTALDRGDTVLVPAGVGLLLPAALLQFLRSEGNLRPQNRTSFRSPLLMLPSRQPTALGI